MSCYCAKRNFNIHYSLATTSPLLLKAKLGQLCKIPTRNFLWTGDTVQLWESISITYACTHARVHTHSYTHLSSPALKAAGFRDRPVLHHWPPAISVEMTGCPAISDLLLGVRLWITKYYIKNTELILCLQGEMNKLVSFSPSAAALICPKLIGAALVLLCSVRTV